MEHLRTQYTLILVNGHSVMSTTDVQILAGYQQAVVLVLNTRSALPRNAMGALRIHVDAGVPLLGCVRIAHERRDRTRTAYITRDETVAQTNDRRIDS